MLSDRNHKMFLIKRLRQMVKAWDRVGCQVCRESRKKRLAPRREKGIPDFSRDPFLMRVKCYSLQKQLSIINCQLSIVSSPTPKTILKPPRTGSIQARLPVVIFTYGLRHPLTHRFSKNAVIRADIFIKHFARIFSPPNPTSPPKNTPDHRTTFTNFLFPPFPPLLYRRMHTAE